VEFDSGVVISDDPYDEIIIADGGCHGGGEARRRRLSAYRDVDDAIGPSRLRSRRKLDGETTTEQRQIIGKAASRC